LIVIFPRFFGIDGIVYAGPIADAMAAIVAGFMLIRELKQMDRLSKEQMAAA